MLIDLSLILAICLLLVAVARFMNAIEDDDDF